MKIPAAILSTLITCAGCVETRSGEDITILARVTSNVAGVNRVLVTPNSPSDTCIAVQDLGGSASVNVIASAGIDSVNVRSGRLFPIQTIIPPNGFTVTQAGNAPVAELSPASGNPTNITFNVPFDSLFVDPVDTRGITQPLTFTVTDTNGDTGSASLLVAGDPMDC